MWWQQMLLKLHWSKVLTILTNQLKQTSLQYLKQSCLLMIEILIIFIVFLKYNTLFICLYTFFWFILTKFLIGKVSLILMIVFFKIEKWKYWYIEYDRGNGQIPDIWTLELKMWEAVCLHWITFTSLRYSNMDYSWKFKLLISFYLNANKRPETAQIDSSYYHNLNIQ